ncbi:hypothetical protein TNCV_833961 [Trichonephila clavipes]|nr:hypothetical protein TNCV_833961 [Trichonephila clavipes]
MAQIHAEGAAEQHAASLEDAHLRAHHSCFTKLERCQPETAHLRQTLLLLLSWFAINLRVIFFIAHFITATTSTLNIALGMWKKKLA